jgi:hypothetical protein
MKPKIFLGAWLFELQDILKLTKIDAGLQLSVLMLENNCRIT